MSARSKAWVLMPRGLPPLAVADHEVIEYLTIAEARPVPVTPSHVGAVIFWRERIVPLMDFAAMTGHASLVTGKTVVLGYQLEPGKPLTYVAIALREAPTRLVVDDEAACPLPERDAEFWEYLAKACFSRDHVPTPIISIATLCSAEFRDFLKDYVIEPWLPEDKAVTGLLTAAQGSDVSATIPAKQDTAEIIDFGQSKTKGLGAINFADEDLDDDESDMSDEDEDGEDGWFDADFDDDGEDLHFAADDDAWDDDVEDEEDADESWDDDLDDDLEDDSDGDWDDEKAFASLDDDETNNDLLDAEDDLKDFDDDDADFDSDDDFDDDDEKDLAAARSSKRVQAV